MNIEERAILTYANEAKCFLANADEEPVADGLLIRASIAFSMLVRQGIANKRLDMLDRGAAIVAIASNFADEPPGNLHRAALIATLLPGEGE